MRPNALRSTSFALVLFAAVACGGAPPAPPPPVATPAAPAAPAAPATSRLGDADVAKAGQAYLDLVVELMPESATSLGLHAGDDRLDDRSAKAQTALIAREEAMVKDLDARFAGAELSRAATIDLRMLKSALKVDARLRQAQKPWARRPDFYTEPLGALFAMTARDYAPAAERATKALVRIEQMPAMLKIARAEITPAAAPAVWVQVGAESAGGAKAFLDGMRPFLEKSLPKEKARVGAALKAAKEAYAEYQTWLKDEVQPAAEGQFAAGRELFDWLLAEGYFLSEDADALLAIGIRVFGETESKLDALGKRIDPKAESWKDVVKKVKSRHPTAGAIIPTYKKEMARARKFLVDKDVVAFPPGDDCQVIPTPEFQRSTISAAYDQPPPFGETQVTKGFFFVTPIDASMTAAQREEMLRESDYGDIVDTVVHETYPGHHLQLSFARVHPSAIRKATGTSIFTEGWALYSEELMAELGYYKDEERMMQLEWTLVRAARVLIDVGLHTKSMTFDEAVKVLTDQVGLGRELALSEVKRYTLTPTQPLSYLVGREKLFALREQAKTRDGKGFSLKKFHERLLSHGTLPPGLLAEELFAE